MDISGTEYCILYIVKKYEHWNLIMYSITIIKMFYTCPVFQYIGIKLYKYRKIKTQKNNTHNFKNLLCFICKLVYK